MKKILIAGIVTIMCSSAFAQSTTGPAAQSDNMTKPGMSNGTMDKGSMNNGTSGTTGMTTDKNNPKKEMSKDGSPAAGSKETKK